MEANAATTYVVAAHFNASLALGNSVGVATPVFFNQASALLLASNSTGRVITLKIVVRAKRTIPTSNKEGNTLIIRMPAIKTHCTIIELYCTTGTSLLRIISQG